MAATSKADVDVGQAAGATRAAQRDTTSSTDFTTTGSEHMSDIGQSESWTEFTLECARRSRDHYDAMQIDARRHSNDSHLASMRIQEAASAHDRDNNQQVTRHNDLAIDRQWNTGDVEAIVVAVLAKLAEDN